MSTACGRPQWGEGQSHVDREGVKTLIFLVDIINGWPLTDCWVVFCNKLLKLCGYICVLNIYGN